MTELTAFSVRYTLNFGIQLDRRKLPIGKCETNPGSKLLYNTFGDRKNLPSTFFYGRDRFCTSDDMHVCLCVGVFVRVTLSVPAQLIRHLFSVFVRKNPCLWIVTFLTNSGTILPTESWVQKRRVIWFSPTLLAFVIYKSFRFILVITSVHYTGFLFQHQKLVPERLHRFVCVWLCVCVKEMDEVDLLIDLSFRFGFYRWLCIICIVGITMMLRFVFSFSN